MSDSIKHVNIEITNQCNQKCFYCFNDSGDAKNNELALDTWIEVLRHMKEWGLKSILVTGGEPFMRPGIMDFLRESQSLGLETSVLSNGFKVYEFAQTHKEVIKRLKVAQISLDSMVPTLHDARRGVSGAWRQAIQAIETLSDFEVPVEISCTVSDENINEVKKVGEYCKLIGAKLLVRSLITIGRAVSNKTTDCIDDRLCNMVRDFALDGINCICDSFFYNPANDCIDNNALDEGIVTMRADGTFRAGPISICGILNTDTVLALLEVA